MFFASRVNQPDPSPVYPPNQRNEANTMFNKTIALAFSIAVAFGFAQSVTAQDATAAPATVVIYRADESVKTKRINVGVIGLPSNNSSSVDSNIGKLAANKLVSIQSPAGEYTLTTRVSGTEPLTLDLKPGATYYVHAKVAMRGSRISVDLQEVPGQVARVQQPALEGTI
jgi:hypothetical protein